MTPERPSVVLRQAPHQEAPGAPLAAPAPPFQAGLSNGDLVLALLQSSHQRLVALQPDVLANRHREPLHQLRVSLRRLRSVLQHFGPLLVLPEAVRESRLARVGRALGLARDLDVLQVRLQQQILPVLPPAEVEALAAARRQLKRERRLAQELVEQSLRSGRYLKLLAHLQQWLRQPRLTPLAAEPLAVWLPQWQGEALAGVFLHPGWWIADAEADPEPLHALRKRCKGARYALEALQPHNGSAGALWATRLHAVQEQLGTLNDLVVLERALRDQGPRCFAQQLPVLAALLQEQRAQVWQQWRHLAQELLLLSSCDAATRSPLMVTFPPEATPAAFRVSTAGPPLGPFCPL